MSELLQRFDRETEAGLYPGLKGRKAPLLVDGQNLIFDEMSIQPLAGVQPLGTKIASTPIRGITETLLAGVRNVFFASDTHLYRYEEGAGITQVGSGYTGQGKLWSLQRWGNWIVATNGVDPPQIWKASTFSPLTGLTFTWAEIFMRNRTFMVAFNTSNGPEYVEWSKIDNVEDWARTNPTAGYVPVRDMPGPIVAAVPLGREIAFYSASTMHILSFLGTRYTYGYDLLLKGIGAVGKHAVCAAGAFNYGFSLEGIWRTDGTGFQFISSPAMRDYVFDDLNVGQVHKVVTVHNPKRSSVMLFYPSANSLENNRGVVVDYERQTWSKIGYGRAALIKEGVFPNILSGDEVGDISMIDVEGNVGGSSVVPITASLHGSIRIGYGQAPYGTWPYDAPQAI